MTSRVQYVNFVEDASQGVISGGQVEVRDSAGDLATLYEAETGSTEAYLGVNPFSAGDGDPDTEGKFSFWVEPGLYNITVGVGLSATTYPLSLTTSERTSYPTRTLLAAAVLAGATWPDGTVLFDGAVQYKYETGATLLSDLPGLLPLGEYLDIRHLADPADLATSTTFSTTFLDMLSKAVSNGYTAYVPKGDWETETMVADFASGGRLKLEMHPEAVLIGPSNFEVIEGDGSTKSWTLTNWSTAATDDLSAMTVTSTYVCERLTFGDAVDGFERTGATVSLGSGVSALPSGQYYIFSSRRALLEISQTSTTPFYVDITGGQFDNGNMGYIVNAASGSCLVLNDITGEVNVRDSRMYNSSETTTEDPVLDIRGDSGIVPFNCYNVTLQNISYEYQPDVGCYVTGGGNSDNTDDGWNVKNLNCNAIYCDVAYRSARNGGSYVMDNCTDKYCKDVFLSANISSDGIDTARNIQISNHTSKFVSRNILDLRVNDSVRIDGWMIEDWGRNIDGTLPTTAVSPFQLLGVRHLDASGIVMRFIDWTPDATYESLFQFGGGVTIASRLEATVAFPYAHLATSIPVVSTTTALGPTGDVECNLRLVNIATPLDVTGGPAGFFEVDYTSIVQNGDTLVSVDKYQFVRGTTISKTSGFSGESSGTFTPTIVVSNANDSTFVAGDDMEGQWHRQGNMVTIWMDLEWDQTAGAVPATGVFRVSFSDASLPSAVRPGGGVVLQKSGNFPALPTDAINLFPLIASAGSGDYVEFASLIDEGNRDIFSVTEMLAAGDVQIRATVQFSYWV